MPRKHENRPGHHSHHKQSRNGNSKSKKKSKSSQKKANVKQPEDASREKYRQCGLGSPPREDTTVPQAIKSIKADGLRSYLNRNKKKYDDTARCLIFLYGRSFMEKESKEKRVATVLKLISTTVTNGSRTSPLERLTQIISADGDVDLVDEESQYMYEYYQRALNFYVGYVGISAQLARFRLIPTNP